MSGAWYFGRYLLDVVCCVPSIGYGKGVVGVAVLGYPYRSFGIHL